MGLFARVRGLFHRGEDKKVVPPVVAHTKKKGKVWKKPRGLCAICKKNRAKLFHHTLYRPQEKIIPVCGSCHQEIHQGNPLYSRYLPPGERPLHTDYHLKKRITFRWTPALIAEFKETCSLHGLVCSDITEFLVRELLHKKHILALRKKIAVEV